MKGSAAVVVVFSESLGVMLAAQAVCRSGLQWDRGRLDPDWAKETTWECGRPGRARIVLRALGRTNT